jgi:hypothetical protein
MDLEYIPNGCTVSEVTWLNESLLSDIRAAGVDIIERPAADRPEDFIEDPSSA